MYLTIVVGCYGSLELLFAIFYSQYLIKLLTFNKVLCLAQVPHLLCSLFSCWIPVLKKKNKVLGWYIPSVFICLEVSLCCLYSNDNLDEYQFLGCQFLGFPQHVEDTILLPLPSTFRKKSKFVSLVKWRISPVTKLTILNSEIGWICKVSPTRVHSSHLSILSMAPC